jgi:putative membrane protein
MNKAAFPILPSLLAICSLALSVVPASGQAAAGDKPKPLAAQDKKFIKDAGESLYYELKLAELGKKSEDSSAKQASELVDKDANKIWEELAAHAQTHEEKLPVDLSTSDKNSVDRLGKMKDDKNNKDKADKQLMKELSKEAKKLVLTFETAAKTAQNPELKAYAEKWLPTLKTHLEETDKAEKAAGKRQVGRQRDW